jgi:predicted Zn-dependent protease
MNPMMRVRVALSGVLCLALSACDVSIEAEDELGDKYAEALRSQVPVLEDSAATAWLAALGRRLTMVADEASRDWHFYLVDDSTVNAFAVPGGHVFVHHGLIERAGAYEELAGVMGHEVAHVTLRHSVDQMASRTKTNVVVAVVCAIINICGSGAVQVAIDVGGQALFAKYSRDDESEADSAAIEYLRAAGIDPRGVPAMFERMAAESRRDPGALESWFGSHPLEEARIARTRSLIARITSPVPDSAAQGDNGFEKFKERVLEVKRRR